MFKGLEEMVKNFFGKTEPLVINQKKLYGPYIGTGKFLAIKYDWSEVVATGDNPREAQENAINAGYFDKFAITRAPNIWPPLPLILAAA